MVWIFCIACSLHDDWRISGLPTRESMAPLIVMALGTLLAMAIDLRVLTEPCSITEKGIYPLDGQCSYNLGYANSDDAIETVAIVHLSDDSNEEPRIEVYTTYVAYKDRLSGEIIEMDSEPPQKISERRIVIYLE